MLRRFQENWDEDLHLAIIANIIYFFFCVWIETHLTQHDFQKGFFWMLFWYPLSLAAMILVDDEADEQEEALQDVIYDDDDFESQFDENIRIDWENSVEGVPLDEYGRVNKWEDKVVHPKLDPTRGQLLIWKIKARIREFFEWLYYEIRYWFYKLLEIFLR